jgi:hypothetical protein
VPDASPAPGRSRWSGGALPARLTAVRPPRWWQEIAVIGIAYYVYSLIRNAVPDHERAAFARAGQILRVERWAHIDVEHTLNTFVAGVHWLAYGCDYYYATLHFVVSIGVLVWIYRWHPLRYRSIRTVLVITTVTALIGFWLLPLAPPRMLHGYVDTVVVFHTWGSWGSGDVAKASNQFAAMPSLHIGWSLWCACSIVSVARRTWVRVIAAVYPLATLFVILGTANHFVTDAIGGVVVFCIGVGGQRLLTGRPAFRTPTTATDPADEKVDELLPV